MFNKSSSPKKPHSIVENFTIVACILLLIGCTQNLPSSPDLSLSSPVSTGAGTSRQIWGEWTIQIDPISLSVDIVPFRNTDTHWNVTDFISPPECPECLKFKDLSYIDSNTISLTVELTHPFPGNPTYDGFDVRGIMLAPPELDFPSGTVSNLVIEPDGYTTLWTHEPWAKINPFINFAIENPERRFGSGETHQREIVIDISYDGPLLFSYIVDASWYPPGMVDPENPATSPHCNEAWDVNINLSGPINGHPDAFAQLDIAFSDWQNDGDSATITIEIPGLLTEPVILDPSITGPNYSCTTRIFNATGSSPGIYPALIAIRDIMNDPVTDSLTTFMVAEITVTSEIPPLTGIQIIPDKFALPIENSSRQLEVIATYSDNGSSMMTNGIIWNIIGTDLNGNPLAQVENGLVSRISSRWWGGNASVTAQYAGFDAEATAFCVDPFADVVHVQFGALNTPGEGFAHPEALVGPPYGAGGGSGSLNCCSLGYGGIATLEFTDNIIYNGPGPDFIVFENPFVIGSCEWNSEQQYGVWNETALVEVSQDGIQWFRIPSDYDPGYITCGVLPFTNTRSFIGLAGVNPVHAGVNPDGTLLDGIDPTDPGTAGGDSFDLADVGLDWCRFVRLIDTGDSTDAPGTEQYDDNGDLIEDYGKVSPLGAVPGSAGFDGDAVAGIHYVSPLPVL